MSKKVDPRSKVYYWLKLERNFFKRHDVKVIESMDNGKDYLLFYMKLLLESIDHVGLLRFNETIPYNEKMLSVITNTNIDIVRSAIKIFTELHLMEILEDQTIYMLESEKMMGRETGFAREQRRVRAVKNDNARQLETMSHNNSISISNSLSNSNSLKEDLKDNNKQDINSNVTVTLDNVIEEKKKYNWKKETYFDNEELQKTFMDYLELRASIKAVNTERAIKLLITNLDKLASDNKTKIKIIEQSIMNSWKGVFPLKNEFNKKEVKQEMEWDISKFKNDFTVE